MPHEEAFAAGARVGKGDQTLRRESSRRRRERERVAVGGGVDWRAAHRRNSSLANLSVPVGSYEAVFLHPQFGEKRQAISVTAGAPMRVSMDMR